MRGLCLLICAASLAAAGEVTRFSQFAAAPSGVAVNVFGVVTHVFPDPSDGFVLASNTHYDLAGVNVLTHGRARRVAVREKGLPDVVLCDVMMPRLDGFAFAEQLLREFPGARDRTGVHPYTGRLGRPLGATQGNYRRHSPYVDWVTCLLAVFGGLRGLISSLQLAVSRLQVRGCFSSQRRKEAEAQSFSRQDSETGLTGLSFQISDLRFKISGEDQPSKISNHKSQISNDNPVNPVSESCLEMQQRSAPLPLCVSAIKTARAAVFRAQEMGFLRI